MSSNKAENCPPSCPLATNHFNFIPATGPEWADIALCSDTADNEPAELKMNSLLRRVGLDRENLRSFGAINCRPNYEHKLAGQNFEKQALWECQKHVQPLLREAHKVYVAAGYVASKQLLKFEASFRHKFKIQDWHGCPTKIGDRWIVPTYSPQFLMAGKQKLSGVVCFDLLQAKQIANGTWKEQPATLRVDPPLEWFTKWVDDLLNFAEANEVWVAIDTETVEKLSGKSEDELDSLETQIVRINFSCNPDEGLTVPFIGGYIEQTRRVTSSKKLIKALHNCPTPDMRVLTADLQWIPAGELKVSDKLVGIEENVAPKHRDRRYVESEVTHTGRALKEVFKISFSNGSEVKVTREHPWLKQSRIGLKSNSADSYMWVPTSALKVGQTIKRQFDTWETGNTYTHGYLAGFFDGEGTLYYQKKTNTIAVNASQNEGPTFTRVCNMLDASGYKWVKHKNCVTYKGESKVKRAHVLGGTAAIARFLGETRPQRLLDKFRVLGLGAVQTYKEALTITAIEPLGEQEIVTLSTSSHTYILEGFAAHNCRYDLPLLKEANCKIEYPVHDTMHLWKYLQSDLPASLGFIAPFYSKYLYNDEESGRVSGAWKHLAGSKPGDYAAIDSFQTLRIALGMRKDLIKANQWDVYMRHCYDLDRLVLHPAEDVGLYVDRAKLLAFKSELEIKEAALATKIAAQVDENNQPLIGKWKKPPKDKAGVEILEREVELDILHCTDCGEKDVSLKHICASVKAAKKAAKALICNKKVADGIDGKCPKIKPCPEHTKVRKPRSPKKSKTAVADSSNANGLSTGSILPEDSE